VAYTTQDDQIGPVSLSELAAGRADLATAVRARRATAASYGAGFALFFLLISAGPYRRGDVWAWWALLLPTLLLAALVLLRMPMLGSRLDGTSTAALIQLVIVGLGLALGAGRLGSRR
jgi:hypothetical protein